MNKDERRKVAFISRLTPFWGKPKSLKFNLAEPFDFTSVKNILSVYVFNPCIKSILKIFSKSTSYIEIKSQATSNIKLQAISKQIIETNSNIIAKLRMFLKIQNNCVIDCKSSSKLFLKAKPKNSGVDINTSLSEKYTLYSKSENNITANNTTVPKLLAKAKSNNQLFVQNIDVYTKSILYSKSVSPIKINNASKAEIQLITRGANTVETTSIAHAKVYIPIKLKTLYEPKIKNWYDNKIEDVFFGAEVK